MAIPTEVKECWDGSGLEVGSLVVFRFFVQDELGLVSLSLSIVNARSQNPVAIHLPHIRFEQSQWLCPGYTGSQ